MPSWMEWIVLTMFLGAAIHVDTRYVCWVFPAAEGRKHLTSASVHCIYWIFVALAFHILVAWYLLGEGEAWFSGYLLEFTLSVDNLFVFQLMFRMFNTPDNQIDKALLWGISAAAGMRLVFFIVGTKMVDWINWIKYPFGVLLLITAWRTLQAARKSVLTNTNSGPPPPLGSSLMRVIGFAETHFPFVAQYEKDGKFFTTQDSANLIPSDGVLSTSRTKSPETMAGSGTLVVTERMSSDGVVKMTMLGAVVLALAVVDVIFALDAVAAKVSQSRDLFVNFTSSLLAMMSFRSLYHIIVELTVTFALLKYGIALVLGYVGIELIVSNWIEIPSHLSCFMILAICFGSILGSLVANKLGMAKLADGGNDDDDDLIIQHIEMKTHSSAGRNDIEQHPSPKSLAPAY